MEQLGQVFIMPNLVLNLTSTINWEVMYLGIIQKTILLPLAINEKACCSEINLLMLMS
jgi:hypothetical protein